MIPMAVVPPTIANGMKNYREVFCREAGFEQVSRYVSGLALPMKRQPWVRRSTRSSLLRDNPPLFAALVLSASRDFRLRLFPYHHRTGSHVPHQSLNQVHAAFMPETIRAVSRLPPDLSRSSEFPRF